jgi:predicted ATP-grasp superfamily ATP-dependent carboligase
MRPTSAAIVLGTEVNGIAVIRSLGRLGVKCGAVFAKIRGDFGCHSRYLACRTIVPRGASDDELLSAVRATAGKLGGSKPTVVFPTTDRYSEFLSANLHRLGPEIAACCPDKKTGDAFLDKWSTAKICVAHGILIPRTECPTTAAELAAIAHSVRYPVIVKPRYTYGTAFPGKNAVFDRPEALIAFLRDGQLLGASVVQEIIASGDGDILVTATYSGTDGRVKALYSGRKIRQHLPDYGATCFGVSERHPDLEEQTRRFLDGIDYKGFAALEFARSRDDGRAYFLELNTRTYYHNQLFADAGVDLTQVAYGDRTGYRATHGNAALAQRDGVIWLDFRRDFQSMRIKRRQGRIGVWAWLKSLTKARSFANWNWRDPLPFAHACAWRTREVLRALLRIKPA